MRLKKIVLVILLIAVIAVGIGLYMFNKGPINIEGSSGVKITATELYNAFNTDTVAAAKLYSGKILEVKGMISSVSVNQQHQEVIMLKTNMDAAFINCTLENENTTVAEGRAVTVKGICSGIGQGDEELGIKADIYLTRSVIVQ